jgi:hypothetical protein
MEEASPSMMTPSHVPDVGERRIVRTAPGIVKGRSPYSGALALYR